MVVTIDDDGQNPPSAVLVLARALRERDLDVVYGRFHVVEQSLARRVVSRANRWLSRMTIANDKQLAITNVRAIRGDLARWLGSTDSAYPYIDALLFRATSRIAEAPVDHRPRVRGESNYTFGALARLWLSHVTTLTILPLQVAVVGSFGTSAVGFLHRNRTDVEGIARARRTRGVPSLFCGMTFLFSILFAFLGIISSYLGRMYVNTNERGLVWERPRPQERSDPAVAPKELG